MKNNNKKRACCLYRVSTAGQVEKDDIPMQKQRCREFADEHGWEIVAEHFEKGVSGYKKSIFDREEPQKILADAAAEKFDILLVFMFDRIGRRGIETTYFTKLLADEGIEIWSAVEGQQSFDTEMDELISAMRFTQAKGESKKTSIRTKTRLGQIVQEGRYRGGKCPYGYKLVKRGRMNRRHHEVNEIEVDETEAEVVRMIFSKYVNEGYGAQRLAKFLTEQKIFTRDGRNFTNTTINHMLKNVLYTGVLVSGETRSEVFPHLQIITPELFASAAQLMQDRTMHKTGTKLNTKGEALLSGLVYCADCGTKLVLTSSSGRSRKGQQRERRLIYQCHNHVRHPSECGNQSVFAVHILDPIIDEAVKLLFSGMKKVNANRIIKSQYEKASKAAAARVDALRAEYDKIERTINAYKAEVSKVLCGESKWDADMLRELLTTACEQLSEKKAELNASITARDDADARMAEIRSQYDSLVEWSKLYRSCSPEAKKMILSKLIERIEVSRGYEVKICWRISYAQFCGIAADESESKEKLSASIVSAYSVDANQPPA